jgi:ParB/RepB/Spo0J family partition protein
VATTLEATLAAQAKSTPLPKLLNDSLHRVAVELLDDNPWQPRSSMDERELSELVDSIRAQGLIQPIAVKPRADGRFIIVAGHRRARAFQQLLGDSTTEASRQKWCAIPAVIKLALDDAQLAAQAYMENVARAGLTPLDEARALEAMVEKGLARTNEELATLVQQAASRIKRLRRLVAAPTSVKDAVSAGLMVCVGEDADGKEKRELRRLELNSALAFIRLHEQLKKTQPKKADERTEVALRRALGANWSVRRCENHVEALLAGREAEVGEVEAEAASVQSTRVFSQTPRRFVIDVSKLQAASVEQLAEVKAAVGVLLETAAVAQSGRGQR